jgi:hypothetical protein
MQATPEHLETLRRIQQLQPGDTLVSRPQVLQDLVSAGFVRASGGAVAITLDGTLWLAENRRRLAAAD